MPKKSPKKRSKHLARVLTLLIVAGVLLAAYAALIEPRLFATTQETLALEGVGESDITIVQFSDTHLGSFYSIEQLRTVVAKINEQQPDIVVFTGDLFDAAHKYKGDFADVATLLTQIEAPYGKYAVAGNHDTGGGAHRIYPNIMQLGGFTLLVNESVTVEVRGTSMRIMGADDAILGQYDPVQTARDASPNELNLLLLHEPDFIEDFLAYPIDLALSGHSHGGQVALPLVGAPIKTRGAKNYTKGLYTLDTPTPAYLYVNTGLGNTKLPFRLLNVPNITVFTLTAA